MWRFGYQDVPTTALCFGGADFASREAGMRSTTGAAMVCGYGTLSKSRHRRSRYVPSPTGEAEFYALTKAAAHSQQLAGIMNVLGCPEGALVGSGATAGVGIACRKGRCQLRHLEAKWLWVQNEVAAHRLKERKLPTEVNPADLVTKYFLALRMRALLVYLNLYLVDARDNTDARFCYSEHASSSKLVQRLVVLVVMTVTLFVAERRRCILRTAVATALRRYTALRAAATHPAVTTGTVVNTSAQPATPDAVHKSHAVGNLSLKTRLWRKQSRAFSWT